MSAGDTHFDYVRTMSYLPFNQKKVRNSTQSLSIPHEV